MLCDSQWPKSHHALSCRSQGCVLMISSTQTTSEPHLIQTSNMAVGCLEDRFQNNQRPEWIGRLFLCSVPTSHDYHTASYLVLFLGDTYAFDGCEDKCSS